MSADPASAPQGSAVRRPAWQTYIRRYLTGMGIYFVLFAPVVWLAHDHALPGRPWVYMVAAAPAVGVAVAVWSLLRFLGDETDEYQRMLAVRAFIGAAGVTLVITTGWGLMQWFAGLPKVSLVYVFPLFFACQTVTTAWVRVRAQ